MAKKGRPFTYQSDDDRPVTISVRLPAELAALVKRYAAEHGQLQISELIREGLEWRIGDGDPRGVGLYLGQPTGIREQAYSSNTVIASTLDNSTMLEDMRAALARQEAQIQALRQTIEQQPRRVVHNVIHGHTAREPQGQEPARGTASMDTTPEAQPTVLQAAQNPASARVEVPAFDTTKHHLATLCKRRHAWGATGQSLRNEDDQCLACRAEAKAAKDAAKRALRAAQHAATTTTAS